MPTSVASTGGRDENHSLFLRDGTNHRAQNVATTQLETRSSRRGSIAGSSWRCLSYHNNTISPSSFIPLLTPPSWHARYALMYIYLSSACLCHLLNVDNMYQTPFCLICCNNTYLRVVLRYLTAVTVAIAASSPLARALYRAPYALYTRPRGAV